jgi:hypothetical protein
MRKLLPFFALSFLSLPAFAQVSVEVRVPVPVIRFEAPPPLVYVQPGVQVVQDSDEEVYVVNNVYWVRRGDNWYRSNDHRGHWVVAQARAVPVQVVRMPPGQYRRYHGPENRGPARRAEPSRWVPPGHREGHGRGHDHEENDDHDRGEHGHGHGHD